jgi:serine/threonine-protein kinase
MHFEQLGPYRIGRELGRGGMGVVFAAVEVQTGSPAAVKVLAPDLGRKSGFRERFVAEIESLRKLHHPNIVRLFGFGEQDGAHYYAMEMVEGQSLEQLVGEQEVFTWSEVVDLGVQACRALKHAHDRGVVHRDIKPANLLLATEGVLKLSDFGIARLFGAAGLTHGGGVIGTAEFMSPEQAEGRPASERSDLYSLGGVLYTLLAGRAPFQASTLPEMLRLQQFAEPEPLRHLAPRVPIEVEEIIHQLLCKEPSARIPSALVLARRLEATRHGLARRADELPPPSPSEESSEFVDDLRTGDPPDDNLHNSELHNTAELPPAHRDSSVVDTAELPPPAAAASAGRTTISGQLPPLLRESGYPPTTVDPPEESDLEDIAPRPARFVRVAGDEHRRHETIVESAGSWISLQTWLLMAALAATGMATWYFSRPPSADKLYVRITGAVQDPRPDLLRRGIKDTQSFLDYYQDDARADEVADWRDELLDRERRRRWEVRARASGRPGEASPIEREYLKAVGQASMDPALARRRLRAIIDLYGGDGVDRHSGSGYLQMARNDLERLASRSPQPNAAEVQFVEERLAEADRLDGSDPAAARKVRSAVVELYVDKSWARDLVDRANRKLIPPGDSSAQR